MFPGGGGSDFEVIGRIVVSDDGNAVLERLQGNLGQAQSQAGAAGSSFLSLGNIANTAFGVLMAGAVEKAWGSLQNFFGQFLDQAAEAERNLARLTAVIQATGGAAGLTVPEATALARSMRDLFEGEDDAALGAESVLMRFRSISGDVFPEALKQTANLAAIMGTDASAAAQMLGRALAEPGFGLQRLSMTLGLNFLPEQTKAIQEMTRMGDIASAQRVILEQLAATIGGQAAAQAGTFAGRVQILKNHLGELGEEIGNHLLPFAERLLDVFGPLAEQVLGALAQALEQVIDAASGWGYNIIASLADGMASAASVVADVINQIGAMIASFLAPGSPPRFLAEIDSWGRSAMTEFLKGMTQADFAGMLTALGPMFGEYLARIGVTTEQLSAYQTTATALAAANKDVADAQKALNDVTAQYDAILTPLREQLAELGAADTREGDQRRLLELQAVLGDVNKSESEKEQARLEIQRIQLRERITDIENEKTKAVDAAKAKLDAAQAHQTELETQHEAQRAAIEQAMKMNELLDRQATLLENLTKAAAGAGRAAAGAGAGLGARAGIGAVVPALDTEGVQAAAEQTENVLTAFAGRIGEVLKPVLDALGNIWQAFVESSGDIRKTWGEMWAFVQTEVAIVSPEIRRMIEQMLASLTGSLNGFADFWRNHHNTLLTVLGWTWRAIFGVASAAIIMVTGLITATLKVFSGDWEGAWQSARETLRVAFEAILAIAGTNLVDFLNQWSYNLGLMHTILLALLQRIKDTLTGWFDTFKQLGADLLHSMQAGIEDAVAGMIGALVGAAQAAVDAVKKTLGMRSLSTVGLDIGANLAESLSAGMLSRARGLAGAGALMAASTLTNYSTIQNFNLMMTGTADQSSVVGGWSLMRALLAGGLG